MAHAYFEPIRKAEALNKKNASASGSPMDESGGFAPKTRSAAASGDDRKAE
mgnify:CR=1 FL=1